MRIRKAEPNDFDSIWKIWLQNQPSINPYDLKGLDFDNLKDEMCMIFKSIKKPFVYLVAEQNNEICGWISVLPIKNNPVLRLYHAEASVYVSNAHIGSGAGYRLIKHMCHYVKSTPLKYIYGWSHHENSPVNKIVAKLGWYSVGSIPKSIKPNFEEMHKMWVYLVPAECDNVQ